MEALEVITDFLKGKHTPGQMLNAARYFFGRKQGIVDWQPIYISVFPTLNCNLNCDMCITHSKKFANPYGQQPTKDIDFELFKQILDRYKNSLAVNLIGNGEPLLHKDLFRMIEYAAKVRKMYTYSSSNGLIVDQYIDRIIKSPLTGFTVSVNGHNAAEFHRMTGMPEKCFETIRENTVKLVQARNAKKSKLQISAGIILDKHNYTSLKDMIAFGGSLGVDNLLFFPFVPTPAPGFTAEERSLFSDMPEVVKAFAEAEALPKKPGLKISLPPLLERSMNGKFCSVPFYNIVFDGEGRAGGCSCQILNLTDNKKFGGEDVWNNAELQDFRRRFLDPAYPLLEPCTWCYNNQGRSRLLADPSPFSHLVRRVFRRKQQRNEARP
jgi:MoaA/NifB/PqqE/SkfB family radical SAM enzyme